jgi:hypothetical protein
MTAFLNSLFSPSDQELLLLFLGFCWDSFLVNRTPQTFLDELQGEFFDWIVFATTHVDQGMASVTPGVGELATDFVSHTFYTLANMPADPVNIIAMLEEELEPADWPWWLRDGINDISRMFFFTLLFLDLCISFSSSNFGEDCLGL